MVDFRFTQEQEILRKSMRRYFENYVTPSSTDMFGKGCVLGDVWNRLVEFGVSGFIVPEEYGGLGLDWTTTTMMIEELAHADLSHIAVVPAAFGQTMGHIVNKYGKRRLKEELLPKLVKGQILGIASTESECGTDFTNLDTTILREGAECIVNGKKQYISLVKEALEFGGGHLVTGRSANDAMNMVYVPIDSDGITTTEFKTFGPPLGGIEYDEVRVPEYYLIGEEGKGGGYAMQTFIRLRVQNAMGIVGMTGRLLELGMDYIKERRAFGRPIGKFEGIQFELAEHYARWEAVRWLTYIAAWIQDEMEKNGRFTSHDLALVASESKLLASLDCLQACLDVLRWHGALGITTEVDLHLVLRNVFGATVSSGTIQAQKVVLATTLLGRDFASHR